MVHLWLQIGRMYYQSYSPVTRPKWILVSIPLIPMGAVDLSPSSSLD